MGVIEPDENLTRTLSWKPLTFLSHIKRQNNDARFPLPLWETWFSSTLGVPIPVLIGPSQQYVFNVFRYDLYGDHLQTCQTQSGSSQVHDWVVYRLGTLFGSVGQMVKIHMITPASGKERGDIEIKDYVVLQKPQAQDNRLSPPHTLIMDFTMTYVRFGCSHLHPIGQLTHTRRSDGAPDPDGALKETVRIKIRNYHQLYLNGPDPIAFLPMLVDTSVHIYDDFSRLLLLHAYRETSALVNELPEESDQFRFLHTACLGNLKGSVGLILTKVSAVRISIPLDLSSRSIIPLPRFIRSRCPTPLLVPYLVLFPPRSA
jgi:hypothetical protein